VSQPIRLANPSERRSSVLFLRECEVAGLPIAACSPEEAARRICELAARPRASRPLDIHLVNAYSIAQAESVPRFRAVLQDAGGNLPDGKPLAWFTRGMTTPLTQVRGPALFDDVMGLGREYGASHFLLGTTDETLALLKGELQRRHPGVKIAGMYSPPFRPLDEEEIAAQDEVIRRSGANIVWVGLGTPKQDFEARRLASKMPILAIAIGAAFDFVAGTKREAPSWMAKVGMEWIFRFASEPRRLWRRYLIGNTVFLRAMLTRRSR